MADIPVEKKSGSSWWKWLLALLALLLLVWLFFEVFIDEGSENEGDAAMPDTTAQRDGAARNDTSGVGGTSASAAAGGTVTSLAMLLNASNPQRMAGRQARLEDMYITSVVGDSAFFVSPSQQGDRAFPVALDEVTPAPPPGTEGRYDVTEGQLMTIMGTVRELSGQESTIWNVQGADRERLENNQLYVRAQQLQITQEANQ